MIGGSMEFTSDTQTSRILELRLKHAPWRRTSGLQPHEYLVNSHDSESTWILETMKQELSTKGYWDTYSGYWNQYLEIGGFRYWMIDDDGLNRERLPISRAWPGSNAG
jgi:hypothetical protein